MLFWREETRRARGVLGLLVACAAAAPSLGCVQGQAQYYPLYLRTALRLPPSKLARLSGYVRFVDDEDVSSYGSSFELLPGCRLVGTPSEWGQSTANSGFVMARTGRWTFALPMRAGYQYAIEVNIEQSSGPTGRLKVQAFERDAHGTTTREFPPASSADDVQACRQEAPGPANGPPR
jgi:hypothetical protein